MRIRGFLPKTTASPKRWAPSVSNKCSTIRDFNIFEISGRDTLSFIFRDMSATQLLNPKAESRVWKIFPDGPSLMCPHTNISRSGEEKP